MAEEQHFDLVVIGGGPGGYVGAIRGAQLGMSVACVERDALGGVCLNWGCIPTKALLAGAEFYRKLTIDAADWGIHAENVSFDWDKVIGRSRDVSGNLNKGVGGLFKKHKITHLEGHGFIPKQGVVEVYDKSDTQRQGQVVQRLQADNILVATGAGPKPLPGVDFDGQTVIGSKEAMTLNERPEKLLIVGAGAIGMEFAYFYNAFGTEVTVVEMLDRLLPVEDKDVSKQIARAFRKQGITTYTGHKTDSIEAADGGIRAEITPADQPKPDHAPTPDEKSYGAAEQQRGEEGIRDQGPGVSEEKTVTIEADKVLVAIGVQGRFDGLFADDLGVDIEHDHIKVDYDQPGTRYETSVPGIHAVGDVIGPPWLAHVAMEEAVLCVERIHGERNSGDAASLGTTHQPHDIDYTAIPGCTYCNPQVASLGYTEQRCQEEGLDYEVGNFPFQASGKAQALGDTAGFIKIISDKQYGEILGVHMIGEGVTELIAEMGLARRLEATTAEIISTMHAHPTMSEAVHEAALGTEDRMIHF